MLLLSDLSRRIHDQYTVFEEEYRYGTQISEIIPKVLIVSTHKNFRLIHANADSAVDSCIYADIKEIFYLRVNPIYCGKCRLLHVE